MAARPFWKGYMKLSLVTCPVAMMSATSEEEKVRFHVLNRRTGNRIQSHYVDAETGKPVEEADEVKGYARGENDYVLLDDDELEFDRARERPHHRHSEFRRGREHRLDLVRHALLPHPRRSRSEKRRIPSFVTRCARPRWSGSRGSSSIGANGLSSLSRETTELCFGHCASATKCGTASEYFSAIREAKPDAELMRLVGDLIKSRKKAWSPDMVADPVHAQLLDIIEAKKKGAKKSKAKQKASSRA